jgi:protein pelota
MQIINKNYKGGTLKLKVTDPDDLWYLSHIIDPKDSLKGTATRKVKIGDSDNAKVTKKKLTLTIQAEKIEYVAENQTLRVNGTILSGPEDIPNGSYQNIVLEIGSECTITKPTWLKYHQERVDDAIKTKYTYLFCLFDRDEALFALSKKSGYDIIARVKSDMPKKAYETTTKSTFYEQILAKIQEYDTRETLQHIVIASPGFYKESVLTLVQDPALKKKITAVSCSSISKAGLEEVTKSPELTRILVSSRTRLETILVEELFSEIGKEGKYTYGYSETLSAIKLGAVLKLFVTDSFIVKLREDGKYTELDEQLKIVESLGAEVHILSSENQPGKKIDGIGSIAATLRYKI